MTREERIAAVLGVELPERRVTVTYAANVRVERGCLVVGDPHGSSLVPDDYFMGPLVPVVTAGFTSLASAMRHLADTYHAEPDDTPPVSRKESFDDWMKRSTSLIEEATRSRRGPNEY